MNGEQLCITSASVSSPVDIVVFISHISSPSISDLACLLCSMNCRMISVLSEEDEGSAKGKSQPKQEKEQVNGFHFPAVDPQQSLFAPALTMVRYGKIAGNFCE